MAGIYYITIILLTFFCGFLLTCFCWPHLLDWKKISVPGAGLCVLFGTVFLTGTLLRIHQLYRAAFLLAVVILFIGKHENRTEKLFWFGILYCITVLMDDIAVLILPGLLNMRANTPGVSELKMMLETLALMIALTISFCFVTGQRKDCDCDLRSFIILTVIVILITGTVDISFIEFKNYQTNYTAFLIIAAVAVMIIVLTVLLCKRLSMYNRKVRELERQQLVQSNMEERVREMDEFYGLVSSLRHDINQQLSIAKMLDIKSGSAESIAFLQELHDDLPTVFDTGIPAFDALMSLKSYECRKAGISLECQLCDLHEHPLSVTELTSVFSNLLNNALEAQKTGGPDGAEKYIHLIIKRTRNVLFIECINPLFSVVQKDDSGRFLSTKTEGRHGYGIESIKAIVGKAGGECTFTAREGQFAAEIFIPYGTDHL